MNQPSEKNRVRIIEFSSSESIDYLDILISYLYTASKQLDIPLQLANSLKALKTEAVGEFRNYVSFDTLSGFPSLIEMLKVQNSYSEHNDSMHQMDLKRIRSDLVLLLDSIPVENINHGTLDDSLDLIRWHNYINKLMENEPLREFTIETKFLEDGEEEKLVSLDLKGYSIRYNLFMNYDIELYLTSPKKFSREMFSRKPIVIDEFNEVIVMSNFQDVLNGYFSHNASDFFMFLFNQKCILPRKVTQTTIGPHYSQLLQGQLKNDPLGMLLYEIKDDIGDGILFCRQEEATLQYDLSIGELMDSKPLKEPHIMNSYHYFVPNNLKDGILDIIKEHDTLMSMQVYGV